ncbi:MAG: dihydrolipoamide acetyltransferase family protein [Bryobacteraceae bacterium]
MVHKVVMPQLGLTMTEGSVSAWLKETGDKIDKGEALFSVETDKVEMEVEATVSGYVAGKLVEPKQVVKVGTAIAVIVDRQEEIQNALPLAGEVPANVEIAASAPAVEERTKAAKVTTEENAGVGRFPASPLAKRLATDLGVDVSLLTPAKGDRISAEDVRRAHADGLAAAEPVQTATTAATPVQAAPAERGEPQISPGRAAIANRVTASFQSAPHFYLGVEVDATLLINVRTRCLQATQDENVRITCTDFFLKAIARALAEQPAVNAYWKDGNVVSWNTIDIGVAVQTEQLLLVPVIRNVDQLTMLGVARERTRLAERARAGRLTLQEMEGGSATLSNLGAFGVDWFQAILNPPQSVIVSTGRIAKRPLVSGDALTVKDTVMITASIDHRVLDGVAGAKFLSRIKTLLEDPALLMV